MRVDEKQYQEEQQAKLIPVGDFRFEIAKVKEVPSDKSKDGTKWDLTLNVYDADDKRHRIYAQVANWKNGGASHMKSFFDSIGLDWTEDHELEDVIELRGMCHTKHEPWNGKTNAKVHWWIPATAGQKIVLPTDGEDDDEFRTSEPVVPTTVTDDDVPF